MKSRQIGCLILVLALVGCAEPVDPNREKTVPVTGTVTYDGSPVEGATVTFMTTGSGRGAVGETDASGQFSMTTYEAGDGVIPGSYKVMISKTVIEGGLSEEEMEKWDGGGEPPQGQQVDKLPAIYRNAAESGLTAEVTDGGENDFPFDLTGDLPAPKPVAAAVEEDVEG